MLQETLTWGPWLWYKTITASSKTLRACDYAGEKLAKFFGITTPKYEYEIDVYEILKAQVQYNYLIIPYLENCLMQI